MPIPLRHAWPRLWLAPQALHPHWEMVDGDYMHRARRAGYRVNVWTVNEAADMERMISLSVDALITDHVTLARTILGLQPA